MGPERAHDAELRGQRDLQVHVAAGRIGFRGFQDHGSHQEDAGATGAHLGGGAASHGDYQTEFLVIEGGGEVTRGGGGLQVHQAEGIGAEDTR